MKPKKSARPKLNFAVDRSEIEISSDWVEAVMGPAGGGSESRAAQGPLFFGRQENNATVSAPATVAIPAPGLQPAAVDVPTTVAGSAPIEVTATVANALPDLPAAFLEAEALPPRTRSRIARPRAIRRITDGLTPGQFAVYSLMYQAGEPAEAGARLYRGGYADLCRLAGLSKRGIQNVIAELQRKTAISVHQSPGYHRTQTSVYRVHAPEAVLSDWASRGLRYALGKSKTLTNRATVVLSAIA
jgi:hypothetical protein